MVIEFRGAASFFFFFFFFFLAKRVGEMACWNELVRGMGFEFLGSRNAARW